MKKVSIICLILLTLILQSYSQVDSLKLNGQYLKHYWTDTRDIVISPLKWQGKDWLKFGLVAGTTTGLMFLDEPIKDFVQDNKNEKTGKFTKGFLDPLGSRYSIGLAASFYVGGLVLKDSRAQSTGLMAIESYLISGILVRIPKELFGRTRPSTWNVEGPFDFRGRGSGTSFPSGHTISVFSVATIFALQYKDTGWVPYFAYGLAGLAGLSRIYDNRHWTSDVFMGAVLGTAMGHLIYKSHKSEQLTFAPSFQQGTTGLYVSLNF